MRSLNNKILLVNEFITGSTLSHQNVAKSPGLLNFKSKISSGFSHMEKPCTEHKKESIVDIHWQTLELWPLFIPDVNQWRVQSFSSGLALEGQLVLLGWHL